MALKVSVQSVDYRTEGESPMQETVLYSAAVEF